jgi:hypothetical protein
VPRDQPLYARMHVEGMIRMLLEVRARGDHPIRGTLVLRRPAFALDENCSTRLDVPRP